MSEQGFATIPRAMLHDGSVPRDAKLVYLILSSHVGGNRMAWPSHKRMADLLGMSPAQVKRMLRWLVEAGHVSIEARKTDDGARLTNAYILTAGSVPAKQTQVAQVDPRVHETPSSGGPLALVDPAPGSDVAMNESQENESQSVVVRDDVEALCNLLADEIAKNDPDHRRPTVSKKWRDACRLMIDRDGREPAKIALAIRWCQADDFWMANILSMPKLREKYPTLQLQARRPKAAEAPKTFEERKDDVVAERIKRRTATPWAGATG